jgi:hypothetical protein
LRNIDDRMALDQIERTIFDHVIVFLFPRVGSWALFRAMRAAGVPASLNGGAADSLLGNDRQIIQPPLRAAASRLNFCRYWELRRILHTLDVADSRGLGIALRNRVAAVAKSCLARLQLLQRVGAVRTNFAVLRNRQSCASPVAKIGEGSFLLRGFPHRQSVAYANFDRASMATVHGLAPCHLCFRIDGGMQIWSWVY